MSVPVDEGQKMTLEVAGMNHEGDGVARHQGFTVFIPGGVPGDRLRVSVERVRPSYARARLIEIEAPSPDRVEPSCHLSSECGGCSWQHIRYESQLKFKRQAVESAMRRIGGMDLKVHDVVPSPAILHYRSKAQVPVAEKNGRLVVGCFARGSHDVVDTSNCHIQDETNNRVLKEARAVLEKYGVSAYDEVSGGGLVRHLLARVGKGTGESGLTIVTKGNRFPEGPAIGRRLLERVPSLVSVTQNINPRPGNTVLGPRTKTLAGKDHILTQLGPFVFALSPASFFQVNLAQAEQVFERVSDMAAPCGMAVDTYCGVGAISLYLAKSARQVVGIESSPDAVKDARANARRNGVGNARFVLGKVERVLQELREDPDVVVTDPPRKGCDQATIEAFVALLPECIIYVSCYPPTLARDLARLAVLGYEAQEVWPYDMFPQTPHVECVVLMSKK